MPVSQRACPRPEPAGTGSPVEDACGADQASVESKTRYGATQWGEKGWVSEHDRCWALTIRQDANGIRPEERKGIQKGKDRRSIF